MKLKSIFLITLFSFFLTVSSAQALDLEKIGKTADEGTSLFVDLMVYIKKAIYLKKLMDEGKVNMTPEQQQSAIQLYQKKKQAIIDKVEELP